MDALQGLISPRPTASDETSAPSKFTDATVTASNPLTVQLDGLGPAFPDSLIDPAALLVGDRVRCELAGRRVLVHGRASGFAAPRQIPWASSSLAANAEVELTIVLPLSCVVTRVVTSRAARLRLYDRASASAADASRASGVYPSGDHGLLLEIDGATAAEDIGIYPKAICSNREATTSYKMRVKNLSGATGVVSGALWIIL